MATSLYFTPNTGSAKEPGTYPVAATEYANLTPTVKATTEGFMLPCAWRAVSNLSLTSGANTSAQRARYGRFFSAPFATDYTYNHPLNSTDAIKYYVADYESNLAANHCVQQCHIFVWRPSTGQVVGTIQPVVVLAPGSKEPAAASSIQSTLGEYFSATPGSISILAGDILVFEPFATFTMGSTTARTIRFYYGGTTEITTENATVASPASKVVFSVDLPLQMPIGVVSGQISHKATVDLRGPRFLASLSSKSRILPVTLRDGSPFISRLKAKSSVTAPLTTQALFSASLKSISRVTAWVQQEHELQMVMTARARASASFPDAPVGEPLNLYYSGTGTAENPTLSIGGVKGPAVAGDSFTATPAAPGITILAVHGMQSNVWTVRVDPVRRSIKLLVSALHYFTAGYTEGVSVVAVGSREAGFVVVRVDSAAATSVDIEVAAAPRLNTLFLNPSAGAIAGGETVYRCLYLFNDTDQDVTNVALTVSTDAVDTIAVATEYESAVELPGHVAAKRPRTIHHRALDLTGWGGVFFLEDMPQVHAELSINSLPAIISASSPPQATDGVTIQVPMRLADDADSTGRLTGLIFGPSLAWPVVKARRGVTFWVRKVRPPGPGSENVLKATISVTADF